MGPSLYDSARARLQATLARRIHTVADARRIARRRVPRAVFDYIDGGAGRELTMGANERAFADVVLRPRMGQTAGVPGPCLATTVLGIPVDLPILLSPVGFTRMMDPLGDVAGAGGAGRAGTIFTLSSMSGHALRDVADAAREASGPLGGRAGLQDPDGLEVTKGRAPWFQLYFLGGRAGAEQLVERARDAGFGALVVTMDTQLPGNRERDLRHGLSPPIELSRRNVLKLAPQVALRPSWLADLVADGFNLELVHAAELGPPGTPQGVPEALLNWILRPPVWDDFGWLKEVWQGKIVVKGVLTGDDARRALDAGADAVVVSNHGGRQLDGVPATLPALVEVVRACGDDLEVYVDGGIRRGSDVVRALALGARAAMIGRAWAYGLAAAGAPGVDRILSVLRTDLDRTLRLLGCASVGELSGEWATIPEEW